MNCLALLCGFFIHSGIAVHQVPPATGSFVATDMTGLVRRINVAYPYDVALVRNPFAVIAIGTDFYADRHFIATFALRHESSIATGRDRGTNSAELSGTWYPGGRR